MLYRIVATITETGGTPKALSSQRQCVREVFVTPTRPPDPPLYLDAYPKEFKVSDFVTLRRHFCSHSLGNLQISAQEPSPVNLSVATPRASTFIPIQVSFIPNTPASIQIQPHNWTMVVKTSLRLRVFHSTNRLRTEPTVHDFKKFNDLFMRVESVNEEVRHYHDLSWKLDSSGSEVPWRTKLHVAVTVPKTILPSFLAPNAALRYYIILNVCVSGLSKGSASAVVPIQLYRSHLPSAIGVKEDQQFGVCEEPAGIMEELGLDGDEEYAESSEHRQEGPPEYRLIF